MHESFVKKISVKGWNIEVHVDDSPDSPLDEFDMVTYFAVWNRNHGLNSKEVGTKYDRHDKTRYWFFEQPADFEEWAKDPANGVIVVMPLYMYDHSGVSISTGREYPFCDPWDAGQCGYVFTTRGRVLEHMNSGWKIITKKRKKRITDAMLEDVKTVDDWLNSRVYGYVVTPPEKYAEILRNEHESCWGFYGDESIEEPDGHMIQEAKDTLLSMRETVAKHLREERKEMRLYAQQC